MARVLVVGAYGLIGSHITRCLIDAGHSVVGMGRDKNLAQKLNLPINWSFGDLRRFGAVDAWAENLIDIDFVVYAAGALQNSTKDDMDAVHVGSFESLLKAAEPRGVGVIYISAAGASAGSTTPFLRTKARAEEVAQNYSSHAWVFRPGMVFAQDSYGGSRLLRMAAVVPFISLNLFSDSRFKSSRQKTLGRLSFV